jgi:glycosyltransferase involved in cell wall biosynthesis
MEPITAVIVCVEYDDLLAITLPHNRPFFDQVIVVTTPEDVRTQAICVANNAKCLTTRVFYERGAAFNKGAALERGFDLAGREGWFAVMDADILIPKGSVIQNVRTRARLKSRDVASFTTSHRSTSTASGSANGMTTATNSLATAKCFIRQPNR